MQLDPTDGRRPAGSIPTSTKRQFVVLILLLAAVVVLSYRLFVEVGAFHEPSGADTPSGQPTTGWIGKELSEDFIPIEPQAPEPFVENQEVLGLASLHDKTSTFCEATITYLVQKIVGENEAFQAEEPVLKLERDSRFFWELYESPESYRGRLVEIQGSLVSAETDRRPLQLRGLDFPNPSGRDRIFQSHVYGSDGKFYVVATVKQRDELGHLQAVRLRGYFAQLYTNEVEVRGKVVKGTIPLIVGEDFELLEVPTSGTGDITPYLPLLITLPLLVLTVVYVVRSRSHRGYARRLRTARRQARTAANAPVGKAPRADQPGSARATIPDESSRAGEESSPDGKE